MENLTFIRDLTPQDVFEIWRRNEESLPHWHEYAKSQGYDSWEEWRRPFYKKFAVGKKEWKLYDVRDPATTVSQWRGGPFEKWQEAYYGNDTFSTFAELAQTSAAHIDAVQSMVRDFPSSTTLTALETEKEGIVVIEGMHRSVALALLAQTGQGKGMNVKVALASASTKELADISKDTK